MPAVSRPLLAAAAAVAVAATTAVAAIPFRGHVSSYTGVSTAGDLTIDGASGRRGVVRAHYVLPATWRRDSSINARSLRFDTRNSCHHKVTFTPRLVEADEASATARAAALTPAAPAYVQAHGTREGAAFRVVRRRGSADLTGVLVQPLPQRSPTAVPAGRRIFAEVVAVAAADPRTRCHAGGPRTAGDAIGDAFGAGSVGGFVLRP